MRHNGNIEVHYTRVDYSCWIYVYKLIGTNPKGDREVVATYLFEDDAKENMEYYPEYSELSISKENIWFEKRHLNNGKEKKRRSA